MHFLDLLKNYAIINYNRSKHIISVSLVIAGGSYPTKKIFVDTSLYLRVNINLGELIHVHDRT